MIIKHNLLLINLLMPSLLVAALPFLNMSEFPETFPSSEHPLWEYQDQRIQVRGFWYPLSTEKGILATTPHLKSCCVGSPHLVNQQIVVMFPPPHLSTEHLITLEGNFRINSYYSLEEVKEVRSFPLFSVGVALGVILVGLGLIFYFRRG